MNELLDLVARIERGEVTLTAVDGNVWAGNAEYLASTGHRLIVFIDCGTWDYFDTIIAPDGKTLWEFPDTDLSTDPLAGYRPPPDVQRRIYLVGS